VMGWVFASLSMTAQYVGSMLNPKLPLAQVTTFSVVSTLILLPFMVHRGKTWFKKVELWGGVLNGLCQALALFMTLTALHTMPSRVVFPVTVLTPLILVLMLSGMVYKERLSRLVWIACGVGVSGLGLLAVFQ
jgi:drug/metabolite transporter (DMT)-like permease